MRTSINILMDTNTTTMHTHILTPTHMPMPMLMCTGTNTPIKQWRATVQQTP